MTMTPTRRQFLRASAAVAAWAGAPAFVRDARAAGEFRIGMFYRDRRPRRRPVRADAESLRRAGGRRDQRQGAASWAARSCCSFANGDGPPAEASKAAVRLMLEEKVDFFIGSHDSATREALVANDQGQGALHLHADLRGRRVRRQHLRAGRHAAAADGDRRIGPGSRRRPASSACT